jgi:uncharacterized protein
MTILIDIRHPAHVHYFKHFAGIMQDKGHKVFFTTVEKESEPYLLQAYGFNYRKLGTHRKSLPGKILGLLHDNWRLWLYSLKVKPDIFMGAGSISTSHVAFLTGKPFIQLEDSGNMEQVRLYLPFAKAVLTPENLPEDLGEKQIRYKGYQEICYLHPKYFTPNDDIYNYLHLSKETRYCIMRFVSWKATHDAGQVGLSYEEKKDLAAFISKKLTVLISAEGKLPAELEKYRLKIPFEKMHDALAFADLFVGEGATMASEAGLLGTPSVYVNSLARCYNEDQEKFGTVFNFRSGKGVKEKIIEILDMPEYKKTWKERSAKLLQSKIDVTAMLVWFVENYPESKRLAIEEPVYLDRFKV